MSGVFSRGWHPDPYGLHSERYFYADNQPGRLVRDADRREFYDDIPADAAPFPPVPDQWHLPPKAETVPAAAGSTAKPVVAATSTNEGVELRRITPISPLPVVDQPGALPFEDRWEDGGPPLSSRLRSRVRRPTKRELITLVVGLAVIALVAGVLIVSGSSTPPRHAGSGGSDVPSTAALRLSSPGNANRSSGSSTPVTDATGPVGTDQNASSVWTPTADLTSSSINVSAVTCAGGAFCIAVGETSLRTGLVLSSTDGGRSWAQAQVPNGVPPLVAVACPTPQKCLAVGETTVLTSTNAGVTWLPAPLGSGRLSSVVCATAEVCVVTSIITRGGNQCQSGETYTTQNDGETWGSTQLSCFVPSALVCPAVTDCAIAGISTTGSGQEHAAVLTTRDTGRTWTRTYLSNDTDSGLGGISCPTMTTCVAAGWGSDPILRTVNGGLTWQGQATLYPDRFYGVACRTKNVCQLVGTAQPERTTSGTGWVAYPVPKGILILTGAAFPSRSTVLVVGSDSGGAGVILSQQI